jgi:hypothetical protein
MPCPDKTQAELMSPPDQKQTTPSKNGASTPGKFQTFGHLLKHQEQTLRFI